GGRLRIIATQMRPVSVIRSLYGEMIRAFNGNLRPTARFYELEIVTIDMLTHAAPKMLIIDEIQHLLSCNAREPRRRRCRCDPDPWALRHCNMPVRGSPQSSVSEPDFGFMAPFKWTNDINKRNPQRLRP